MTDRYKLNETRSPIDPSSWSELNQNWEMIKSYFRFLERNQNLLAGEDVDGIIKGINERITEADIALQQIETDLVQVNGAADNANAMADLAQTAADIAEQITELAQEKVEFIEGREEDIIFFTSMQNNLQAQVNQLVVSGDSSPEAAQARVDVNDVAHSTLKSRIDNDVVKINQKIDSEIEQVAQQLAQTDSKFLLKRDIATKITNEDLDTSQDSKKIKLINLSDEVQQAITGNAPALTTIVNGSITREKAANGAFDRTKLSANYQFNRRIETSESIDTIYEDGNYIVTTGNIGTYPFSNYGTAMLQVFRVDGRWVKQRISRLSNTNDIYERAVDSRDHITTAWEKVVTQSVLDDTLLQFGSTFNVADKSITSAKLSSEFLYRKRIEVNESIDTVYEDGNYVVAASNIGTYPFANYGAANLEVFRTNGRWVRQKISKLLNSNDTYERSIDSRDSIVYPWEKIVTQTVLNDALSSIVGGSSSFFTGKTIVCFGDSLTANGNYPTRIGSRLNTTAINCGFGGASWTARPSAFDSFSMYRLADAITTGDFTLQERDKNVSSSYPVTLERLKTINFNNVEYLTILYGGNDFSLSVPIGDNDSSNVSELKGAINYALPKIMATYPHLKIALISSTWRNRYGSTTADVDVSPNDAGLYLRGYVDAVKEMASIYHIPFLDLYRESGFNKYTETKYISDGIHPTTYGYAHLGDKISSFLSSKF